MVAGPPLKTAPPEGRKVIAAIFEELQKLQKLKAGAEPPSLGTEAMPPSGRLRKPVGMPESGTGSAWPHPPEGPKLTPSGSVRDMISRSGNGAGVAALKVLRLKSPLTSSTAHP